MTFAGYDNEENINWIGSGYDTPTLYIILKLST